MVLLGFEITGILVICFVMIVLVVAVGIIIVGKLCNKPIITKIGYVLLAIFLASMIVYGIYLLEELNKEGEQNKIGTNEVQNMVVEPIKTDMQTDITDLVKNNGRYFKGKVTKIGENEITFVSEKNEHVIRIGEDLPLINARTGKSMMQEEIKIGDFLDTFGKHVGIIRNISGEELKKELLENCSSENNAEDIIGNSFDLIEIEKINSEKALVTLEFMDIYGEMMPKNETFRVKFEVNDKTEITSKSRLCHSIDTLEAARGNIIDITIDASTLEKENPVLISFSATDN
ncbi:MAG TPA: hypothetical protein IAB70_06890 [Candidatus Merdicola faecigallinarum]|uniref:Uncharacterized protein n=1 Tax=Candidatus Merdicola faecigallinarum TaxID=2840862 RepID=A0A9D1M1T7_9FIRM|nr:hypothetical protein [Candidatus Merdicola faecigallinarum]